MAPRSPHSSSSGGRPMAQRVGASSSSSGPLRMEGARHIPLSGHARIGIDGRRVAPLATTLPRPARALDRGAVPHDVPPAAIGAVHRARALEHASGDRCSFSLRSDRGTARTTLHTSHVAKIPRASDMLRLAHPPLGRSRLRAPPGWGYSAGTAIQHLSEEFGIPGQHFYRLSWKQDE